MVHLSLPEIEGALIGGLLISLATSLNFFIYGRTDSMHDILSTTFKLRKQDPEFQWKLAYLFGVITFPFLTARGVFEGKFKTPEMV